MTSDTLLFVLIIGAITIVGALILKNTSDEDRKRR